MLETEIIKTILSSGPTLASVSQENFMVLDDLDTIDVGDGDDKNTFYVKRKDGHLLRLTVRGTSHQARMSWEIINFKGRQTRDGYENHYKIETLVEAVVKLVLSWSHEPTERDQTLLERLEDRQRELEYYESLRDATAREAWNDKQTNRSEIADVIGISRGTAYGRYDSADAEPRRRGRRKKSSS